MPDDNQQQQQQQQDQQQQQQAPWHQGIEAETLGFWQNKGYKVDDPKALATELTKQYRSLESHMGVPPDQLLKMPKADAKPEDIKAFWGRLGAGEAKDYDLSGIKFNGQDLDAGFADAMKGALAAAFVPKDRANAIVQAVVKHYEGIETARTAKLSTDLAAEKALLAKNWGTNFDFNHLKAMEGARRLGITPEAVKALENQVGYAAVMESMRKIGAGTTEDMFHEGGAGKGIGAAGVTTREGAMSRKAELMADQAWGKRYLSGDVAARQEMDALNMLIDGVAA